MAEDRIREDFDDAPRRPEPPPRRRRDEFDEEFEDRPRPRRRYEEDEPDATGGLIPYKNAAALAAYYTGVFSLIPCFGLILAPIALILGFFGLSKARSRPNAGGMAHALVGIVLGGLVLFAHLAVVLFIALQ